MKNEKLKNLIIIGAGGFGREVLEYAQDVLEVTPDVGWTIGGFIDDDLSKLEGYETGFEILSDISSHKVEINNVYVCAIADTKIRKRICESFKAQGAEFVNIIHPMARIGRRCKIGTGNIFCPDSCLTVDVTIGDFVFINCHANCGHDSIVDDYCTISPFCDITGFVHLKEGVFLGSHASVCPSVEIERFSKVGAGAVAISNIPKECTAVGVPAKIVERLQNERNR